MSIDSNNTFPGSAVYYQEDRNCAVYEDRKYKTF